MMNNILYNFKSFLKKTGNNCLFYLSKKIDTHLSWITIKHIYKIKSPGELEDITLLYYITLILIFLKLDSYYNRINITDNYLIISNSNIRKYYNDTLLNIINISFNHTDRQLRRSMYNIKFKVNDSDITNKNVILSHDYNDLFYNVFNIYSNINLYKLEIKNNIYTDEKLKKLTIGDIFHM